HEGVYAAAVRTRGGPGSPKPLPLAQVVATRIGAGPDETRLVVIDFSGENLKGLPAAWMKGKVSFDKGKVRNVVTHSNPEIGGTRLSFQLAQGSEKAVELRAQLFRGDDAVSEVWMDRWTP